MSVQPQKVSFSTGYSTESVNAQTFCVVVKCPRPAYRRAGFSFIRGKNTLANVTANQLAILRADRVLSLVSETPVSPSDPQGGMDVLDVGSMNARIRAAVASLLKDNPDHYTQAGAPRVAAVSEAMGETVTAAQLKAALEEDSAE
jgi:hypothetical protein